MARVGIAVGVIGSTTRAALLVALGALTLGAAVATRQAFAQEPATNEVTLLSADALAKLVGPIALYPDDLVGIVLPASTYPLQVVQAGRFLDERAKDANLKPSEDWDDSVVALLNYPDVVKLMNDDLDWTWQLGDAVINQRADVLDAIQNFRDRAYAAGNLRTDNRQVIENDDAGAITIKPADPEVIYVPYYEPERVVVYQRAPVYYYYPIAYPVYYYPYPFGYSFHTGYFWGVTSVFSIGWHTHFLYFHDHNYWGHPYYGHSYYNPYYYRNNVNVSVSRGGYVWEPHYRHGAQPFTRSDGRRFVGTGSDRAAGMPGSYRSGSGTVSRSTGQQRSEPVDPGASANRNRATPGTNPRADGSGGNYRSRDGSMSGGTARTAPQRSGDAGAGQTNQSARTREASPQPSEQSRNGSTSAAPRTRETAPPPADAPGARAPGQYRSGGTSGTSQRSVPGAQAEGQSRSSGGSQRYLPGAQADGQSRSGGASQRYAAPQQPRQGAAPSVRMAPPAAGDPRALGRTGGSVSESRSSGGGSAYRGESAPPRVERAAPTERAAPAERAAPTERAAPAERAASAPSSRGDGGAAPSYRGGGGGGGESRGNSSRHER